MYHRKILYAFVCICVNIQVFCGDDHEHDHDHDHDHQADNPNPQWPVIFHNPGVFPVVTTQNPYIYAPHDTNYHTPNIPNFQSNTHQRYPGDTQRIPAGDDNYNNQYGSTDRYPIGSHDHQKDREPPKYNHKVSPSYQLSAAFPEGCDLPGRDSSKYCKMTVKITPNKNQRDYYTFELTGKSNGYIAVGLSEDVLMGDDHIVECVRKSDANFDHYQSFSRRQEKPERIRDDISIVNNFHYGFKDGFMTCSFDRYYNTFVNHNKKKYTYDLKVGNHHILLAMGGLKDSVTDEIGYHGKDQRFVTPKYISEMKRSAYYNRNGSTSMSPSSSISLTISIIYVMYTYVFC